MAGLVGAKSSPRLPLPTPDAAPLYREELMSVLGERGDVTAVSLFKEHLALLRAAFGSGLGDLYRQIGNLAFERLKGHCAC